MHPAMLVGLSTLVPFGWLGLLLWLARFEDTLVEDVRKAERRNVPDPILAIPVQRPKPTMSSAASPAAPPAPRPVPAQASLLSRSIARSFGGSTNR